MRFAPYFFALMILSLGTGCGDRCKNLDGPRERYEQLLTEVHSLELLTPAEITLYKDTLVQSNLEIFAQPEVYHVLETDVIDTSCVIALDGCFRNKQAVLINATFPRIDKIYFESAGEIVSGNMIVQDSIRLENTGLGDIDLTLKCDQVFSHLTSSGNIILSGLAKKSINLLSSSGEIDAFNLVADTVVVHTIGTGIIEVYADRFLKVHFYEPTTVRYRGHPEIIEVYGEGTLEDANL